MSTFDGLIKEFPDIRVDYFRNHAGKPPPLACFLSHIHTDHLAGLERADFRAPYIYCSAATRELLIRLETYNCRIEYVQGIREVREGRFKHLQRLLKPLPLDTPVKLRLGANEIQVTLFDANHCPGSVMFLIEGQGKAVLYTGDIRCEPWFVNALTRSPLLIEYTSGLRTLDTIYLDTSHTGGYHFQTKAEGLSELLQKVLKYPQDTVFHFQAWTYGYESVWIALSKALNSRIHVDDYKLLLYESLVAKHPDPAKRYEMKFHMIPEAPGLVGFIRGNEDHYGCLTSDENVRLHSCEKGNYCQKIKESPVVWIQPIVCHRPDGQDMAEVGIGGGGDDLEATIDLDPQSATESLDYLQTNLDIVPFSDDIMNTVWNLLTYSVKSGRSIRISLDESVLHQSQEKDERNENGEFEADFVIRLLAQKAQVLLDRQRETAENQRLGTGKALPRTITFPYSRHASFEELRQLVGAFKPKDVWPCTFDVAEWTRKGISINGLFGTQCSGNVFRFDHEMLPSEDVVHDARSSQAESQQTASSTEIKAPLPLLSSPFRDEVATRSAITNVEMPSSIPAFALTSNASPPVISMTSAIAQRATERGPGEPGGISDDITSRKRKYHNIGQAQIDSDVSNSEYCDDSQTSISSAHALEARTKAFRTMVDNMKGKSGGTIDLISTTDNHSELEVELNERR